MQGGEPNVWAGLVLLRNGQIDRRWRRLQMLMFFNVFAIPLVFGANVSGLVFTASVKSAVGWVGYLLHCSLIFAAWRGERLNRFWTYRLIMLERTDISESDADQRLRIRIFSSAEFFALQRDARVFTGIAFGIAACVIALWLCVAIYFSVEVFR